MTRRLTLDDIADLRAYERGREEVRRQVIALRRRRRIAVGPIVSVVFENRETIRFQVQEMARAERLLSDTAIQTELDTYNPLIPEPGQLSATLFLELVDQQALRTWLPKLVGVERSVELRIGPSRSSSGSRVCHIVRARPEAAHEEMLTREAVTAAVHYVWFDLEPEQVDAFAAGPVELAVDHPAYRHSTELATDTVRELMADLRAG
jgi:hypothetical protein